ncbi:MAG: S8 family peptidase [Geminicoccaceae bacterium]
MNRTKKLLMGTVALACGSLALSSMASAGDGRGLPLRGWSTDRGEIDDWRDLSEVMKRLIGIEDYDGDDDRREGDHQIAFDHDGSEDFFDDPATDGETFETDEFNASITPGQINAQAAYAEGAFGDGVKVGVVDEDFDLDHPDLAPNVAGFEDITAGNRAGQADEDDDETAEGLQQLDELIEANVQGGHGTQVAGVIAAARNGEGIQGVAPEARILAIRADTHSLDFPENQEEFEASAAVDYIITPADADDASQARVVNVLDENGEFDQAKGAEVLAAIEDSEQEVIGVQRGTFNFIDIAEGVDTAVKQNADIINLSLGSADEGFDQTATDSIVQATERGRIVVIANGNEDRVDDEGNPLETLPDSDPTAQIAADDRTNGLVLAVGVVDENNEIRFNNCGSSKERCLVAPGIDIETTSNGGDTTTVDGSSFSAPAVSGSLALLLDLFPSLSPEDAVQILLDSATDLGEEGVDEIFGHGLVNIERAVQPIGVASLPTGDDVDGGVVTLNASKIGLSGAFGDALANVDALGKGLFLDEFRRPFAADLRDRVVTDERGIDFAGALGSSDVETRSFASGGFTTSLSLRDDNLVDFFDVPSSKAGLAGAIYEDQGSLQALSFSGEIADGLTIRGGHNLTAGQQLAVDPVSGPASDLFLFADESLNPQHAFLGKGSGAAITHQLTENTALSVGLLSAEGQGDSERGEGFTTQLDLRHSFANKSEVGMSVAFTGEEEGFLGSEIGGAFADKAETASQFLTLSGTLPLSATIDLLGSATVGRSDLSNVKGGILDEVDNVVTSAFMFGVAKNGIVDDKDSLGLMLSQPLRVESGGAATFLVPTSVNADGSIETTRERSSLAPSGRETNLQLAYSRKLADNMGVTTYALMRNQPGHNKDADNDYGVGMRFKLGF